MGGEVVYVGGEISARHGIDVDRVGYLDLVDEVEKMGYGECKLHYKVDELSLSNGLREIVDDRQLMDLL